MITTYEAIFDPDDVSGVFGISLVESPAVQEYFIQLSEDKKNEIIEKSTEIKLSTADEEQRLLVGLVLQPNKPVYRNQDGEEFNIVFNAETIKNLAHSFFLNDYHKNSTIEHDINSKISDVAFVESWTVADPKRDKTNVYNLEYPKGSWVIAMKVNSDEVWNDYVKTGKVKGFSIDAVVKLKKINSKKEINMSTIDKLKKGANDLAVKLGLKEDPKEEPKKIEFGEIEMEGGEIIFVWEGDMLEVGMNVFAKDKNSESDEQIPVPVGSYPLMDGRILVVTEEGVVGEIKEPMTEETPEEPTPAPEEPVAAAQDTAQQIKSILIKYEEIDKKLESLEKIDKMIERLDKIEKEVLEFSEAPIVKPKTNIKPIELNRNGRILAKLRNNN